MKKRFYILSLVNFIVSAATYGLNYIFYHYTGDDRANGVAFKFTEYHVEKGKPFITDLIGQLATLLLFAAIISLLIAVIIYGKEKRKVEEIDEHRFV